MRWKCPLPFSEHRRGSVDVVSNVFGKTSPETFQNSHGLFALPHIERGHKSLIPGVVFPLAFHTLHRAHGRLGGLSLS